MKRNIVWALFFVAMLSVSLAAVAKEKKNGHDSACTAFMVSGTWGYSETGTVYISGVATPYASLGIYVVDSKGKLSGARTAFLGGDPTPRKAIIKGTATVNADCTGTETPRILFISIMQRRFAKSLCPTCPYPGQCQRS
jgi:hypothetical protein